MYPSTKSTLGHNNNLFIFIFLILNMAAVITIASSANLTLKLGALCTKHNYKYISLLTPKFNYYSHFYTWHSQKLLMDLDLRVRRIWNLQDLQPKDFAVIYYDPNNPLSYKDWQGLSQRKVKTSLIITQVCSQVYNLLTRLW